jgi:hypothetical protein
MASSGLSTSRVMYPSIINSAGPRHDRHTIKAKYRIKSAGAPVSGLAGHVEPQRPATDISSCISE